MSEEDKCDVCLGKGFTEIGNCPYCNGTGEWNRAAQAYLKNHICQCIFLDRKNCPVCHKPCHHDTPNKPGQRIVPGGGGISTTASYSEEPEVKEITA